LSSRAINFLLLLLLLLVASHFSKFLYIEKCFDNIRFQFSVELYFSTGMHIKP
jgi:hypothetical protein